MKTTKASNWKKGFAFCMLLGLTGLANAGQKGLGDSTGIARAEVRPEVVSLTGELIKYNTHPCEMTTGKAPLGTHLILKMADGRAINLHLGPSTDIERLMAGVKAGSPLQVKAFRTKKMKENDYVAVSLTDDKQTVVLRDPKTLRPVWAGKQGQRQGRQNRLGTRQRK
jgi:hypothetical protein